MGYKHVMIHHDDLKKIIDSQKFNHINEYLLLMESIGLRPYKKDIKPVTYGGIGTDPKINHFCIRINGEPTYKFKYIIINKQNFFLAKIKYGL